MSNAIEKLAAAGHLTPRQVERIGRNVAAMVKAANEDPQFRQDLLKVANPASSFFGHIGGVKPLVGTAITLAGINAATGIGSDAYGAIKDSIMKARNYKGMMSDNPDLAKMDSKLVQRHFNTLSKFNPDYAGDPNVAGQYVKDSIQMERTPIEQVNQIVKARSEMDRGRAEQSKSPMMGATPHQLLGINQQMMHNQNQGGGGRT